MGFLKLLVSERDRWKIIGELGCLGLFSQPFRNFTSKVSNGYDKERKCLLGCLKERPASIHYRV